MAKQYKNIEGEIRKDSHRNYFFTVIEEDIDNLINPFRKQFKFVHCPNCASSNVYKDFQKGQFSYYRCSVCDTLYVNPRPPINALNNFYLKSKAVAASTQSLLDNEEGRKKHVFTPRAKQILQFFKSIGRVEGRVIEIGCSVGSFLDVLKKRSRFQVEGIDPSESAHKIAAKKRLKVHKTTLEKFDPAGSKYDIAISLETIEHIFSPQAFLLKINRLLKKGGFIVFTTPNLHGFDTLALEKYYKNIHAPCHLNYFNVDTIDSLLTRSGFKIIEKRTPGVLDIEIVRKQIGEGACPQPTSAFVRHLVSGTSPEIQANFQKFLQDNRLSGNMLVFARKV